MRQIIIDFGTLGGLSIRIFGYGLMMVLGFLSAIAIGRRRAKRMGENPDAITQIGILSLIGGVLGARLAFVIEDVMAGRMHDLSLGSILNITSGGLIYYGGVALGSAMVLGYLLIKRLPIRRHLDMVAVSMMVGLAFGRAGCLLNGCCYGGPCRHDWALRTEFPVYSTPLLKFDGRDNPFSEGQDAPSPVYHHQLIGRAKYIHTELGGKDRPTFVLPESVQGDLINPPPELVNFATTDRTTIERDGEKIKLQMLRLHPPRELHGKLDRDQLAVAFRPTKETGPLFEALAGTDAQIDQAEWSSGLAAGDGLLGGSEHWGEALVFDTARDGKLSLEEFVSYAKARRVMLLNRFDENSDMKLTGVEHAEAKKFLQDSEIAAALNDANFALPVKPAQALGIINALLLAAILTFFYRLRTREGQVFALLFVLYPITRFMLEAIRDDNPHNLRAIELTHNQWSSLAMTAGGVVALLLLRRLPASCGATWAQRLADSNDTVKK